jgi:hypothetical protein
MSLPKFPVTPYVTCMEGITGNCCMLEMELNNPREKYRGAIYVTSL